MFKDGQKLYKNNVSKRKKCEFTNPLMLAHYDPRQQLIVNADTSQNGIKGCLNATEMK